MMKHANAYLPYPVRIEEIITETVDGILKTFKLRFLNPEDEEKFAFIPGQFAEISVPGKGEIPIGIASSPTEKGFLYFTVQRIGSVTGALHNAEVGDVIGLRGPLGNYYPWQRLEGKNVVIIGGGCAFSTLRSSIVYMLDPANRPKFKNILVVYGARSTGHLLYRDEILAWQERDDIDMHITVDGLGEAEPQPNWALQCGLRSHGRGAESHRSRQRPGAGLRTSGDAALHQTRAESGGFCRRRHHPVPGKPHEVRRGHVRSLQRRRQARLQGRPGVHAGRTGRIASGLLTGC